MSSAAGEEAKLAVGVDVGKSELVAAIWLVHEQRAEELVTVANSAAGIAQLIEQVEARHYAGSLGRRAKTDQQDAFVLARYTAERQPAAWTPPPEALDDLEMLLARRDLASMLQAERNRQHSVAARVHVAPAVNSTLVHNVLNLKRHLDEIEQAITELLEQHPPLVDEADRLDSIPGVGPKTVGPLLAVLLRWHQLTGGRGSHRGLTAFIGLDPTVHQSGTSVRKRGLISKKGNPAVRAALYQAALGAIRGHNALHDYYDRLVASGKRKKVALVACAHKILIWAWHIFCTKMPYDPALHAKTS